MEGTTSYGDLSPFTGGVQTKARWPWMIHVKSCMKLDLPKKSSNSDFLKELCDKGYLW